MADLQRALEIAVQAHKGQLQKDGLPYVLHPIKLMMSMNTDDEKIAAVLHDVIEDTPWSLEDLRNEGFSETLLDALECLTHSKGLSYEDYIEQLSGNPLARQVKLADLQDNMDIRRIPDVVEKDLQRLAKYHRVWKMLMDSHLQTS